MVSRVANRLAYTQGSQKSLSVENNFTGGLKTEFTGMNFPENACTDTSNCVFSLIGDVERRGGIDFEANATQQSINTASVAMSTYRWRNAGGDGATEILVQQVGATLYFFKSSAVTVASPVSSQLLSSSINLNTFLVSGSVNDPSQVEATYADGNGYLFVYHPYCDAFYCTLTGGIVQSQAIIIRIRDFNGVPDGLGIGPSADPSKINTRPQTLSNEHKYNLLNQGWTNATPWSGTDGGNHLSFTNVLGGTTITMTGGTVSFTIAKNIPGIANGQACNISEFFTYANVQAPSNVQSFTLTGTGVVNTYTASTGVLSVSNVKGSNSLQSAIFINPANTGGFINTIGSVSLANTIGPGSGSWNNAVSNYPSNADIWWVYKDTAGAFAPALATGNSIIPGSAPAPQGHFIYNAFNQNFGPASGIVDSVSGNSLITAITTTARATNGAWFAGRVWFTGVSASQSATGDQPYYTWTENIYFSQVIQTSDQFGYCYQVNDPTNQNFFDILPTDGGVITIPGTGTIYKLFPVINGMLVFAQNGIWFIAGGQSLGFTAVDYSINKISNVQSISTTSFVNVLGTPFFWNQEGIYTVKPGKDNASYTFGGLNVPPLTVGTILSFYNNIPLDSKIYARGDYDPNSYIIQWVYRSTQEAGISNRYHYDSILNLNVYTQAFYPYAISANDTCTVNGIVFMNYPSSLGGSLPLFKYPTSVATNFTYAEENDFTNYVDWHTKQAVNYTSFFTTGYKLHGKGFVRWKPIYIYLYLRNTTASSYTIQALWDFSTSSLGRSSLLQTVVSYIPKFGMLFRRHKLRGHGHVMQFKVSSVAGQPFDIMGWSIPEALNPGV